MRRAPAILGSAIFLVIAPGSLAAYVPWYLTQWHLEPALFPIARVIGGILIAAGLPILLDSFARFALQGLAARRVSSFLSGASSLFRIVA
jgi:hypothetical protein